MTEVSFPIGRRAVLGGFGCTLIWPAQFLRAQSRTSLALEAVSGTIALKPDQPPTPMFRLTGGPDQGPLRFRRGEIVDVTLANRLPVPIALNWIGLDGNPAAEPMTAQPPLAPSASATYPVTFRDAGTLLASLWMLGDDARARPTTARAVLVSETEPFVVDRDEVLVFQDWLLKPDGGAIAPGADPTGAVPIFSVNGMTGIDITANQNQRLRFRLINSSQSTVVAIQIQDQDVRVMAIDGQPAEPFLARDGLIVAAPGSRIDVIIDAIRPPGSISAITLLDGRQAHPIGRLITSDAKPARPAPLPIADALPSNDLPAQIDLKSAFRIDLALNVPAGRDRLPSATIDPAILPDFRVKRGRTVVLTLTNRGATPVVLHLHGHHFRLLDRLDDGWKPFWLDTLTLSAGQTQRIAFKAEHPGRYPIEETTTVRASPRKLRSYLVD